MGAVDLVIQIEAPPSVACGMQRIGRAGHQVGRGLARGDLPEVPRRSAGRGGRRRARCATGEVEETRYPRNPLDVLAQQIVAMAAPATSWPVDELYALVRRAAPFAELGRAALRGRPRHARRPLPVR